jgi:hypothetical protein
MGLKTVYLPGNVPVRFVTIPGCARIRIDLEGSIPLGYDPGDERLFVFGDQDRKPVNPPLSEDQTRALMHELAWYNAERLAFCTVLRVKHTAMNNIKPGEIKRATS